ncbi:MAG: family 78 glycoside hydrolase catalytic domain [Sphingomonadaceae bacterium]|nr:family 78 glycoside hydrolase catalytic domain [Sphingomonadaceae bacterium]
MAATFNRRQALAISGGVIASCALPAPAFAASRSAASGIAGARTCGLNAPLALGDMAPRFSWYLADIGESQKAYRIRAARNLADLKAGRSLLLDSGKVPSSECLSVAVAGAALPSRTSAVWQVEVWTNRGKRVSKPGTFETGLYPEDWRGGWIAAETPVAKRDREAGLHWIMVPGNQKVGAAAAYRWTFEGDGGVAEILLAAHEMGAVTLNGQPLEPLQDGPVRWTQMAVYPVTLATGRNVLAVDVTRHAGFGEPRPFLAAMLRHGPELVNRTTNADRGWKASLDPAEGWRDPAYDDKDWPAAEAGSKQLPAGEPWPVYPANYLRKRFTAEKPVRSARLYATALGCYEAWINGERIGDAMLAPEFTDPSRRVLYQAYDVTDAVRQGANMLGFHVGDGWYGSKYSGSARFSFGPAPCRLLAQLELEYADGSREVIASGEGWETTQSPVLGHSIYDGEVHDARLDRNDWAIPDGSSEGWRAAELAAAPAIAIDPQRCEPIRAKERRSAQKVARLGPGRFVVDFGQNFAGWAELALDAPRGTEVTMKFAELANPDGSANQANLRSAWARDVYIAAGTGREQWVPRFTYHGFRYVELEGVPDDPSKWSLTGIVGHQDLPVTGEFRIGDATIRKFWENSLWSQKSNFWGLPTDCPQRDERLGWMGDAEVFWPAAAYNMDVGAYTARVMDDMRASQSAKGAFPDVIPPFVPGFSLTSPGWADAGVILPFTSWWQYGDGGVVEANWAAMDAYMAYIAAANPDHLWRKLRGADYGDWLAVDAPVENPGAATTPKDLISTAFWARNAAMMAQMAAATGRNDDAARYNELFATIRAAFTAAFLNPDGSLGNGSQTSQILPIRFGLLEGFAIQRAGKHLAADISNRGNHLSTGFLGTPHILDALAMSGHEDLAMTLLLQRDFPSWGYMVEKGATTMWERWNSDGGDVGMNSRNHYAFGAIGSFLFRRIAGIDAAAPGFTRLNIAPLMDPRLKTGGATYASAMGEIRTDWVHEGSKWQLDVHLPAGVTAAVLLPDGKLNKAAAGSHRFSG